MSYYAVDNDYFQRNDWLTWLIDKYREMNAESKQLTVAYAAGASLAAITLIYVFGPTFFIDGQNGSKRKQTVVGLYNPANDCFVNSVLQALAGIGELRTYLVQRILLQNELELLERKELIEWKGRRPILTRALKLMLDKLNERPLHRKTITTRDFILELERVFRSRISRNQQDAQEFLQIVAQTLAEEYEAQEKVKAKIPKDIKERIALAKKKALSEREEKEKKKREAEVEGEGLETLTPKTEEDFEVVKAEDAVEEIILEAGKDVVVEEIEDIESNPTPNTSETPEVKVTATEDLTDEEESIPADTPKIVTDNVASTDDNTGETGAADDKVPEKKKALIPEFGMPMEGKLESGIECLVCGFQPKPTSSTFIVLTLNVPQKSSVTLDDCLNEHLSPEHIDDFQCAKCKLNKTIDILDRKLGSAKDPEEVSDLEKSISTLRECLETDPEKIPKDVSLPAPNLTSVKSRIVKRTYFAHCPDILSIHLSRSIFDYYSRKNSCKVSFPEEIQLGPLLSRSKYKLLGVVTHKGSHDSGHYECYRRQNSHPPPYSTPLMMPIPMPMVGLNAMQPGLKLETPAASGSKPSTPITPSTPATPATVSQSTLNLVSTTPTSEQPPAEAASSIPSEKPRADTPTKPPSKPTDTLSLKSTPSKPKKHKNVDNRWWRISDDSIKDVKTSDVLSLHKEVYLLFYEKVKAR